MPTIGIYQQNKACVTLQKIYNINFWSTPIIIDALLAIHDRLNRMRSENKQKQNWIIRGRIEYCWNYPWSRCIHRYYFRLKVNNIITCWFKYATILTIPELYIYKNSMKMNEWIIMMRSWISKYSLKWINQIFNTRPQQTVLLL